MKKLLTLLAVAALVGGASIASAQTATTSTTGISENTAMSKVAFPVAELGGCASKEACRLYCEDSSHKDACLSFAQKVGLMSKEKIAAAKLLIKKQGPGSCDSKESCLAYCQDSSHQDECFSFAKTNKILSEEKATLIQKFTSGEGPGACKSAATCKMYCEDSSHRDECRTFAEENGLARKVGSSTAERVKAVIASTTPGRERGMELRAINGQGTTTPGGQINKEPQKKLSSTTPSNLKERPMGSTTETRKPLPPPKPTKSENDLGAVVLKAFVRLLGF